MRLIFGVLLLLPIYSFGLALPSEFNELDPELRQQIEQVNQANERQWAVSAGMKAASYSYAEPQLMELSGFKAGLGVETSYYPDGVLFSKQRLSFDAEYMQGKLDYDGSLIGSNQPYKTKDSSAYYLNKFRYEKRLANMGRYNTWIGAGLGYRFLRTRGDDVYGYTRDQTYLYAPITFSIERNINNKFGIVYAFEYDFLIQGRNKSYVGSGLEFEQTSGSGVGAKLQLEMEVASTWIYSNINYHRWMIADSTINKGYIEPKNNTDQLGLGLGAFF